MSEGFATRLKLIADRLEHIQKNANLIKFTKHDVDYVNQLETLVSKYEDIMNKENKMLQIELATKS